MRRAATVVGVFLVLIGCAAVGPLYRKDVDAMIARGASLPPGEPVRIFSRAYFLPGSYGFKGMLDSYPATNAGLVACTDARLLFVIWDDERETYVPRLNAPFVEVDAAEVKTYGLSERLVIRMKGAGFLTFELTTGAKLGVNQTEAFAAFISERAR